MAEALATADTVHPLAAWRGGLRLAADEVATNPPIHL
jgi:hypothetical protein